MSKPAENGPILLNSTSKIPYPPQNMAPQTDNHTYQEPQPYPTSPETKMTKIIQFSSGKSRNQQIIRNQEILRSTQKYSEILGNQEILRNKRKPRDKDPKSQGMKPYLVNPE